MRRSFKDIARSPKGTAFRVHATMIAKIIKHENPADKVVRLKELIPKSIKELILEFPIPL
jgi:hypothetical protein